MEAYKTTGCSESSNCFMELLVGLNSIDLPAQNQKCFEVEFEKNLIEDEGLGEPKEDLEVYHMNEHEKELEEGFDDCMCGFSENFDEDDVEDEHDECANDMLGTTEEATRVTIELIRECVLDYDKFDRLDFLVKEQLLTDLADNIAMNMVPEAYITSDAFKILMTQLDTDFEPSISWVAAMLVIFYSRKRIELDEIDFALICERAPEYEHVGSLLQALFSVIQEAIELKEE